MAPSMCSILQNMSPIRRRESPLNLYFVAMIIRCSFLSTGVQATPDIFRSFFYRPCRWWRKVSFFLVKNCKRNPISVAEIILKF